MNKAVILGDAAEPSAYPIYSLLGQFESLGSAFLSHVALLAVDASLPGTVQILHMGPPLVSRVTDTKCLSPDVVFSLPLDEANKTAISRWAKQIDAEDGPTNERRYTICPPVKQDRSENGRVLRHRFSCAGYALEAFSQIGILLCDIKSLPLVGENQLHPIYPQLAEIMTKMKLRTHYGIENDPPWPVLLPGYLFHGAEYFVSNIVGDIFRVPGHEYALYP